MHYTARMRWLIFPVLLAAATSAASSSAFAAAADSFTLVNGADVKIDALSIRRFGTEAWKPLAGSPSPGAKQRIAFSDPDCAFDIQARLAGGAIAVWSGVNLCEVNAVVLNRNESGATWVDYQ